MLVTSLKAASVANTFKLGDINAGVGIFEGTLSPSDRWRRQVGVAGLPAAFVLFPGAEKHTDYSTTYVCKQVNFSLRTSTGNLYRNFYFQQGV
jgi:hypothetical protein